MTLLLFLLILSVLVFVHELGHFIAAKKAGIEVEEFGFGLPPRVWCKKVGETLYSINALPIGGFVKLAGEDGIDSGSVAGMTKRKGKAYFEVPIWRRLTVLLAGVTMNLLLAIVCFSVLYFVWGIPTKTGKVIIEGVSQDSPAFVSGIKEGDQIISIDGTKLLKSEDLINFTKEKAGKKIELQIFRRNGNPCEVLGGMAPSAGSGQASSEVEYLCKGKDILLSLIPREKPPVGEGPLGVAVSDTEFKKYPFYIMPFLGAREGLRDSFTWGKNVLSALGMMLSSIITQGKVPSDIAGPVGIYQITGQAAKAGWLAVLQFIGILSVNLAVMNILPFPALDGGRLVFLVYEAIFRKKANPKIEAIVNQAGMIFLLSLMALITANDILRLIRK